LASESWSDRPHPFRGLSCVVMMRGSNPEVIRSSRSNGGKKGSLATSWRSPEAFLVMVSLSLMLLCPGRCWVQWRPHAASMSLTGGGRGRAWQQARQPQPTWSREAGVEMRAVAPATAYEVEVPIWALHGPAQEYDSLEDLDEFAPDASASEVSAAQFPLERQPVETDEVGEDGSGLKKLQTMWLDFQRNEDLEDLDDTAFSALNKSLARDLQECPSADTIAWAAKALDEMLLDDDGLYAVLAELIKARVEELSPQGLVDAVRSFGNMYWGDMDLTIPLAAAVRQHLKEFSPLELSTLVVGFSCMGAMDAADERYIALFMDLRKFVYDEEVEEYLKKAVTLVGTKPGRPSLEVEEIMKRFPGVKDPKQRERLQASLQFQLDKHGSVSLGQHLQPAPQEDVDWIEAQEVFRRMKD